MKTNKHTNKRPTVLVRCKGKIIARSDSNIVTANRRVIVRNNERTVACRKLWVIYPGNLCRNPKGRRPGHCNCGTSFAHSME